MGLTQESCQAFDLLEIERTAPGQLRKGAHVLWRIDTPARFSPWAGETLALRLRAWARLKSRSGGVIMPAFSPALITIMRSVLEDAMTRLPAEQATTVTKAYLAEFILKAAAGGLTSYESLITAAVAQLPTIVSTFI